MGKNFSELSPSKKEAHSPVSGSERGGRRICPQCSVVGADGKENTA